MKLKERLNEQIRKVQALPKKTKRIIFWSAVIIAALGLLFFWADYLVKTVKNFSLENVAEDSNIQDFTSKAGQAMNMENELKEKLDQLQK